MDEWLRPARPVYAALVNDHLRIQHQAMHP